MGTVRSALSLYDGMSGPLRSITTAMNILINTFETVQSTSKNAIDTASLKTAREELARVDAAFDSLKDGIKGADNQQKSFNNSIKSAQTHASNLKDVFFKIGAVIGGFAGLKKVFDLSDKVTNTSSRIKLIVEDGGSVLALENKIRQSAKRARAAYMDTADAVAKMALNAGNAFSGNDEIIKFMELVNKQFVIGGATAQEQSNAMIQLTQAMAAGALRGEELNSILDGAPGIARAIEQYMGVAQGSIKQVAEQGLITSEVVKNAMFMATNSINTQFESMPKTWAQVWIDFKDRAIQAFTPVLNKINELANNPQFSAFVDNMVDGLYIIANVCSTVIDGLLWVDPAIADNWGIIQPIVMGVVAALILYNTISAVTSAVTAGAALASRIKAAADMLQAGSTFAATVAQHGLNAALLACPITWIVMAIIVLVVAVYAAVAAFNACAGASVSATGIIFGAVSTVGAFIWNLVIGLGDVVLSTIGTIANCFIKFANFLANVCVNPVSSIIYLFQGMADTVLSILQGIAKAIDSVFGSNLAGAVSGWRSGLEGAADRLVKHIAPKEEYKNFIPEIDLSMEKLGVNRIAYKDAYTGGYGAGENLENKLKDMFSKVPKAPNLGGSPYNSGYMPYNELAPPLDEIAKNTGKTADAMEIAEEDLKYMCDLAEREAINRFTTAEIKLDFSMQSEINSNLDLDGVADYVGVKVLEAAQMAAEGVHV